MTDIDKFDILNYRVFTDFTILTTNKRRILMIGFGNEETDKFVSSVLMICMIFIFFWGAYDISNKVGVVDWVKERAYDQPTPRLETPVEGLVKKYRHW